MRVILFIAISFLTIFSTKAKAQYSSPMTAESEILYQEDQQPGLYRIEFVGWNYQRFDGTSGNSIPSESGMGDSMVGTIRITSTNSEYENGYVSLHIMENIGTMYPRNGCFEFDLSELRPGTSKEVTFNLSVEGVGTQYISAYVGPYLCGSSVSRYLWSNILNQQLNIKNTSFDTSVFSASLTGEGVTMGTDGLYNVTPGKEFTVDVLYSVYDPSYSEKGDSEIKLSIAGQTYVKSFSISDVWEQVNSNGAVHMLFQVKLPNTVVGDQELRVEINPSNVPEELSRVDNSITQIIHTGVTQAEISVKSVKLAQVIYNPEVRDGSSITQWFDIPLKDSLTSFNAVLNKSASFEVNVGLAVSSPDIIQGTYKVKVKNSSGGVVLQSFDRSIEEIPINGQFKITPDQLYSPAPLTSFIPSFAGLQGYSVEVETDAEKVKASDPFSISLNAIKTNTPTIAIHKMYSDEISVLPVLDEEKFQITLQSGKYLSSIFPVANNAIVLSTGMPLKVSKFPVAGQTNFLPFLQDVQLLERLREEKAVHRSVGVVSGSYFLRKIGISASGINPNAAKYVALVIQGQQDTLAHELAHSFGVRYEAYASGDASYEPLFVGYDANPAGYFGNTRMILGNFGFMGRKAMNSSPLATPNWIDPLTYGILFDAFQKPTIDPETTVISAVLSKEGKISSAISYDIVNGVESSSAPDGDLEVQMVDSSGKVLISKKLKSDYGVTIRGTDTISSQILDIGMMPVILEFPKTASAVGFQVYQDGKKLVSLSTNGLKLVGAVQNIPLEAFQAIGCRKLDQRDKLTTNERESLIELAKSAQREIDKADYLKAKVALKALGTMVKLVMKPNFVPTDSYSLSRSSLLSLIESIEKSLTNKHDQRKGG